MPPLFSLDGQGRVLYLSTFSQTIAPSLRIAYLCLPPRLMERLRTQLGFYACAVPSFEQFTLARFIASGDYERHLNRLRKRFRGVRAAHFHKLLLFALLRNVELHAALRLFRQPFFKDAVVVDGAVYRDDGRDLIAHRIILHDKFAADLLRLVVGA